MSGASRKQVLTQEEMEPSFPWAERLNYVCKEMGVKPTAPEIRPLFEYVNSIVHSQGQAIKDGSQELAGRYPGLKATPWMDPKKLDGYEMLKDNFKVIQHEALNFTSSWGKYIDHPQIDGSKGHDYENWTSFDFVNDFQRVKKNWQVCQKTAEIIQKIPYTAGPLSTFSKLAPHFHLNWHSDGYAFVVSFHVAIQTAPDCGLVVGGISKHIPEGTIEVMNSSFQHTAWNYSSQPRIHLLIDFWHPALSKGERDALTLYFKDGSPSQAARKY